MARPFSQDWEKRMAGTRPRPTSDTATVMNFTNGRRPFGGEAAGLGWYPSTEARAIDQWFEDLSNYEKTLEQMSEVKLMDSFKEELRVIDAWFVGQNESERTTVLYALLRHCTPLQVRFFITVLDQMAKSTSQPPSQDPVASILSPRSTMVSPRNSVSEDTVGSGLDLEEREMEASRRLLQKLPPVHHHDESPSESEGSPPRRAMTEGDVPQQSAKSQSRRLYDRHSSGSMNPISPITSVSETWAPGGATSSSLFTSSTPLAAAGSALSGAPAVPPAVTTPSPATTPVREPLKPLRPAPPVPSTDAAVAPVQPLGSLISPAPVAAAPGVPAASAAKTSPSKVPSAAVPAAANVVGRKTDSPTPPAPEVPAASIRPAPPASAARAAEPSSRAAVAPMSPTLPPPPPPPVVPPPPLSAGGTPPPTFSAVVARSLASPTSAAGGSAGATFAPSDAAGAAVNKRASVGTVPPLAPLVLGLAASTAARRSPTTVTAAAAAAAAAATPASAAASAGTPLSISTTPVPASATGEGTPRDTTDPFLPPDDIPSWLKTLRLHKYSTLFEQMTWPEMLKLDEDKLHEMGMGALGARRKLLKAIESVVNGEPVSPTAGKP